MVGRVIWLFLESVDGRILVLFQRIVPFARIFGRILLMLWASAFLLPLNEIFLFFINEVFLFVFPHWKCSKFFVFAYDIDRSCFL